MSAQRGRRAPQAPPPGWAWHPQFGWLWVQPVVLGAPRPAPRARRSHGRRHHRRGHGAVGLLHVLARVAEALLR